MALSSLHAPSPQGVSVVVVAVSVFHVRRLIVVLNCDPLPSTLHAVRYLKPSSPFVVFSQYLEVPGLGVWCGLHVAVLEWRWLVAPFPLWGKFFCWRCGDGCCPFARFAVSDWLHRACCITTLVPSALCDGAVDVVCLTTTVCVSSR